MEQIGAGRDEDEVRRSNLVQSDLLVDGEGHGEFLRVGLDVFRYALSNRCVTSVQTPGVSRE